jgi:hypothetical protein
VRGHHRDRAVRPAGRAGDDRLAAFETRCNAIARPFTWKFTRADLSDLLRRIDAHDKTKTHHYGSRRTYGPDH